MEDKFSDNDVWDNCPICNEKVGNGEAYSHCKKQVITREEKKRIIKEAMEAVMAEMEERNNRN